jgi:hypothetical protein
MNVFITIFVNCVQPPKGPELDPPCLPSKIYLIVVIVDGMVMLVKALLKNTRSSIVVTKGGKVKVVKPVPEKQLNPIVKMEGGNEMLVRFVVPLNAPSRMCVTVYVVPSITKLSNTVSDVDNEDVPPNTSAVPNPILYS